MTEEQVNQTPEQTGEQSPATTANTADATVASPAESPPANAGEQPVSNPPEGAVKADADDAAMMEMLNTLPEEESDQKQDSDEAGLQVSKAEFQQLSQPSEQAQASNLDLLMDINLPVSIELGRTKMPISELLALGPGSVVELNKLAGEPVDVMVNQKLVARGEVVVIDENFGVRITQLMTPEERLKLLGEEL